MVHVVAGVFVAACVVGVMLIVSGAAPGQQD